MSELVEKALRDAFPDAVVETKDVHGVTNIKISPSVLVKVCEMLKSNPELKFNYLGDITAIDWEDRIEVVYNLVSIPEKRRVALRVDLDRDKPQIDSVTGVWKGAEFQEREAYDLMGVVFNNHPDLRRILLPGDWEGHPLRKDYVIPED